jgi:hypothetical protein
VIPDDPGNADWQAFQAFLAAGGTPDPAPTPSAAPSNVIGYIAFTALFSSTEQAALFSPTATAQVRMLVSEAISAGPSLDLDDPRIIAGVNTMVTLGILTQARAAQILAGTAPPVN